ncbi:hypothetical protein BGZ94_003802 [Podila epigama]|nr:hypothetical protein BGZ94_003802 [Podila epigama]
MAHNPSTNELSRQNAPTASIRSNDKSPSLRDKLLQVGVGRQEMFKIKLLEFVSAFDEFALKDTAYIVDEYMKELNQRTYLENENRKLKDAYTVLYGQKEQLAVQLAQVTTQQQRKQHELELSREHSTKEIDHSVSLSDDTASGNLARLQKEHDIAVSELYRAMDDVAKLNARVVHLEELNKVLSNNLTNKDNVNKELGQIVESKIMSIRKMDAELALATSLLSAKAVEAQAAIRMIGYCYAVLDPLVQENSKELADDLTYLKAAFERLPSSTVPHGQLQKTVEVHYQKVATDATNLQRIIESMGLPLQESMAPTTNTPQLVVGAMDSSNAPNNASGTKVVAKKAHRPTTHTKSISKGTKIDFTKDTRNHAVASSQTVSGNSPLPADVVPITTVPVNTNAINRNAPTQSSFTTNVITPATTEALPHSTPVLVPVTQPLKWKEPVVPTGAAFVHPHGSTVSPLAASSLSSISAAPVTSHIATAAPPQTSQAPALPQSAIMPVSSGRSQEPHETELATKPDGDKAQAKVTAKSDHGPSAKALEEKLKTADIQIQALISAATDSTDGRTGGQPTGSTHTLKASPAGKSDAAHELELFRFKVGKTDRIDKETFVGETDKIPYV